MPTFTEAPNFVSKDLGPQCEFCFHYKEEHNGPGDHCMHVMYTIDEPELNFKPKKYCSCKGFKEHI